MSAKTLSNFTVSGALYPVGACQELTTGDTVRLFLDQTRNASFPESVTALVSGSVRKVNLSVHGCVTEGRAYNFTYESDDLEGAADHLDICDVIDVAGVPCCEAVQAGLTALTQATSALISATDPNGVAATGGIGFIGVTAYSNVLNGNVFTVTGTAITVGSDITDSFSSNEDVIDALVTYINTTSPGDFDVIAVKTDADNISFTAKLVGTEGNALSFSTDFGSEDVDYSITAMNGGADPIAANQIGQLCRANPSIPYDWYVADTVSPISWTQIS